MTIIINLLLAVFGLGLISRVLLKIVKKPLFGEKLSTAVNEIRHLWWNAAKKLLSYKPEATVLGLFFVVLWPSIVFLNIFLLAQLLELYFPGGERIAIPLVGSYSTFPLIMGGIWVLVQVAFGILFDRTRSIWWKILLAVIIIFSIGAEGWLAHLRANLLLSGEEMVSPTLWDIIILKGPILAFFIGIIIPSAEIPTGTIAFKEFIAPLLKAIPMWVGGIIILLWYFIASLLFPDITDIIILPNSMAFLKNEFKKVLKGLNSLKGRVDSLGEETNGLDNTPKDINSLEIEISKLKNDINENNEIWNKLLEKAENNIKNAGSPYDLEALKRKEIRNLKTRFKRDARDMKLKSDLVYSNIKEGYIKLRRWIKKIRNCKNMILKIEHEKNIIKTSYRHLNDQAGEINLLFREPTSFEPHFLADFQVEEFKRIKGRTINGNNPSVIDRSIKELNWCIAVTNQIEGLEEKINEPINIIEQVKGRIPDAVPPLPTNDLITKVLQIEANILEFNQEIKQRICDIKKDLKRKGYQLGMAWYRRIFLSIALFMLFPLLNACDKIAEEIGKNEKPRFVIVLLDETGSFALEQEGVKTQFWSEIIPWASRIVDSLNPGEGFGLIGIDDQGFDTEDIRISLEVMDEGVLKANIQKKELKKRVKELTRREGANYTDIMGALSHAAYLLNNMEGKYQGIIVIFSDMVQTQKKGLSDELKCHFPDGTKGYCFYVNATGQGKWDFLINKWDAIFKGLNLDVKKPDGKLHFYQRGEMKQAFKNTFGSR